MIHKHTYNEAIRNEICEYTRNFTKRMLLKNLGKEYKQQYGLTLQELVDKMI